MTDNGWVAPGSQQPKQPSHGVTLNGVAVGVDAQGYSGSASPPPSPMGKPRVPKAAIVAALVLAIGGAMTLVFFNSTPDALPEAIETPAPQVTPTEAAETVEQMEKRYAALMGSAMLEMRAQVTSWRWGYEGQGFPPVVRNGDFLHVAGGVITLQVPDMIITVYGPVENACFQASIVPPESPTGDAVVTAVSWDEREQSAIYFMEPCPARFVELGEADLPTEMPYIAVEDIDYFAAVGMCTVFEPKPVGVYGTTVDAVERVFCSEPHDYEVVGTGFVPFEEYPGDAKILEYVQEQCDLAMVDYSGRDTQPDEELYSWYGQLNRWDRGFRDYECTVSAAHGRLEGSIAR